MKKFFVFLFIAAFFLMPLTSLCETAEDWQIAPVLTKAYEISSGKLYLEWEGNAPVYQVYMDGKSISSVIVNNAVISISQGTHTIHIYPIDETKEADTTINIGVGSDKLKVLNLDLGIDLALIGLDPKKLVAGTPSDALYIDYSPNTIFITEPEQLQATTDLQDRVLLSFTDRYHADEYIIGIKIGKDINYIKYTKGNEEDDALIQQNKTLVTLTLEPEFLEKQECMIPELDNKYTFSVQLRKYAENLLNGEKITTAIHQSKESNGYSYTPTAAWKTAPVISYASQTADGQITLQWDHENFDLSCEYVVVKVNKAFGIKTGEEELGRTKEKTFTINDLMNGNYSLAVFPILADEKGSSSYDTSVSIQNDWVVAPILVCEEHENDSVRLVWNAAEGVESYHITVHKGNSESLLRFIDLDYSKYAEYDIPATSGEMEYTFVYEQEIDPSTGEKFKFEIFGIRHSQNGEEQKTASSSKTLTIGLIQETED